MYESCAAFVSLFHEGELPPLQKRQRKKKSPRPTLPKIEVNPTHEKIAEIHISLFRESDGQATFNFNAPVLSPAMKIMEAHRKEQEAIFAKLLNRGDKPIMGLSRLFHDANNYKLLTREEEYECFIEYKENPTEDLKQFIICANIKLVIAVAKRIAKNTSKIPFEDMIDEGVLGLIRAIEKFEPERGNKFSTYAYPWIHQAITRFIANTGDMIRVPVHFTDNMVKIRRFKAQYMTEHGCLEVPDEAVEEALGIPLEKVQRYTKATQACASLDVPIDEGDTTFLDMVEDKEMVSPENEAMNNILHDLLMQSFTVLDEREKDIIVNHFNLNRNENPLTMNELAKKYGITKVRIRQIETDALKKLREAKETQKCKAFCETHEADAV